MKKQILLSFLVLCNFALNAQWIQQNSGTDSTLNSVYFIDQENGWAVGEGGIILYTTDGGENWNQQISGTDLNLQSVHFFDQDLGWIVGGVGEDYSSRLILRTQNGGSFWDTVYLEANYRLNDIYFINSLNGWVVGKKSSWPPWESINLSTQDGGETWVEFSGPQENYCVYFIDELKGWLAGGGNNGSTGYPYGYINKTEDGGNTWIEQTSGSAITEFGHLRSVYFVDNSHGWAVGGNPGFWPPGQFSTLLRTNDGGLNWEITNDLTDLFLTDVFFTDSLNGWVVGGLSSFNENIILNTKDGGQAWYNQFCEVNKALNSICFVDAEIGWIVGDNGIILHTENGGANSCLPEGISFTTQTQIDSFQLNYPGCNEIEGDVEIIGQSITNLNGLIGLTSIGGDLNIYYNDVLENFAGLDSLESIGGSLILDWVNSLNSIEALSHLNFIGINLELRSLYSLTSLIGLENLTSIPGYLLIGGWPNGSTQYQDGTALTNLAGLINVNSIGGNLSLIDNDNLTNLSGLNNLSSIGGGIFINYNDELVNLSGLENITVLDGSLTIGSYSVYLNGGNDNLVNFIGLDNLTSIGSLQIFSNPSLSSLNGLENLTTIEGSLEIGCDIAGNGSNPVLSSLGGIHNVDYIGENLWIINNPSLSICEIEPICDYLANPNGEINICDNAAGCNSMEEVEQACQTATIEALADTEPVIIKPNPFSTSTTIEFKLDQPGKTYIKIYNQIGQQIEERENAIDQKGKNIFFWNSHHLPPGIYYIRLETNNNVLTEKIVKL